MKIYCFYLFFLLSLTSCSSNNLALGRTDNYRHAWPYIDYSTKNEIFISVVDNREYVINGDKPASFVGLMRGGYGNPWDMHTESGSPMVDDIAYAISSGFNYSGIKAILMSENEEKITKETSAYKKIVFKINEWKSDTYKKTKFMYDIDVYVYDNKKNQKIFSYRNIEGVPVGSSVDGARSVLSDIFNDKRLMELITKI